jgi:ATP-dependent RNA helicase DeaD
MPASPTNVSRPPYHTVSERPTRPRKQDPNTFRAKSLPDGLFGALQVSASMARALNGMGYTAPTAIQEAVIPLIRAGQDVVGQAQTGTGKTAAFGIPLVEALAPEVRELQALVLVPTRELAVQVKNELMRMGRFSHLKSVAIYGGQSMNRQLEALRQGAHVIVATPGRLMDHMGRGTVRLGQIRLVVLDEADQMLDIGFADDIRRILRHTPSSRQTLLFSATMPSQIKRLTLRYMKEPNWILIGGDAEPVQAVEQIYFEVAERDRPAALELLLREPDRITQALVFRRTKIGVDRLVANLQRRGHDIQAIHGDMTQSHRDTVMGHFRAKHLRVLVATNVAARGLDIPAVSHVINYDMPSNIEEYVHRIGRTARMGRPGTAIIFVSEWDFPMLDTIQAHVGDVLRQELLSLPNS